MHDQNIRCANLFSSAPFIVYFEKVSTVLQTKETNKKEANENDKYLILKKFEINLKILLNKIGA